MPSSYRPPSQARTRLHGWKFAACACHYCSANTLTQLSNYHDLIKPSNSFQDNCAIMLSSSIPTSTTATNDTTLGDHGGQRLMGKFHPKTRPFYRWCRRAGCKKYSLHRWYFHSPKRMVPSRLLSFKPGTVHHRTTPGGKQLSPFASEMRDKL